MIDIEKVALTRFHSMFRLQQQQQQQQQQPQQQQQQQQRLQQY